MRTVFCDTLYVMYYFLSFTVVNDKDVSLRGSMSSKNEDRVQDIFHTGKKIKIDDKDAPFYQISINPSTSRKIPAPGKQSLDKISISTQDTGFIFLASPKVQKFFDEHNIKNLQCIDVDILNASDKILEGYKIINILDKIDCVDFEASDLTFFDSGTMDSINELVLDENKIPKQTKMFILDKSLNAIMVHESLKELIEQSDLTGFQFFPFDEPWELY